MDRGGSHGCACRLLSECIAMKKIHCVDAIFSAASMAQGNLPQGSSSQGTFASWTNLPVVLFELITELLLSQERLTLMERTCKQWHRYSMGVAAGDIRSIYWRCRRSSVGKRYVNAWILVCSSRMYGMCSATTVHYSRLVKATLVCVLPTTAKTLRTTARTTTMIIAFAAVRHLLYP